jgi:hypothetical protein
VSACILTGQQTILLSKRRTCSSVLLLLRSAAPPAMGSADGAREACRSGETLCC